MKLDNFADLVKFNKELFDDDYNHGQSLVFKTKSKAEDNSTVSYLQIILSKYFHKIKEVFQSKFAECIRDFIPSLTNGENGSHIIMMKELFHT
jgi:hypothetical protein